VLELHSVYCTAEHPVLEQSALAHAVACCSSHSLACRSRLNLTPLPLACGSRLCLCLCLVITRYLKHVALRAPASIQIYYPKRRLAGKIPCLISLIILVCTALNSTEIVSIILETALTNFALLVPKIQLFIIVVFYRVLI
jgi:hypothetical protein